VKPQVIEAVFFDVGNTILRPFPGVPWVCQDVLARAGLTSDIDEIERLMPLADKYYEDSYDADDTFWTDHDRATEIWVGMYALIYRELGFKEDAQQFARQAYDQFERADRWRAYDDVGPGLRRFVREVFASASSPTGICGCASCWLISICPTTSRSSFVLPR